MLKGFQKFLLRGNVLDLSVAVVMGGAFGAVVTAMVKDLLTPLIAAIVWMGVYPAPVLEKTSAAANRLVSHVRQAGNMAGAGMMGEEIR